MMRRYSQNQQRRAFLVARDSLLMTRLQMNPTSLGGQLNVQAIRVMSQHNNTGYQGGWPLRSWFMRDAQGDRSERLNRTCSKRDLRFWLSLSDTGTAQLSRSAGAARGRSLGEVPRNKRAFVGCGLWQTCRGIGVFKDVHPPGWVRPNFVPMHSVM